MTDDVDKLLEKFCNERHATLGKEIEDMKEWLGKVDNRTWLILVAIIINIGVQIALKF